MIRKAQGLSRLNALRGRIDKSDARIVWWLGRRMAAVQEIGQVKKALGLGVVDLPREARILKRLSSLARRRGLSSNFIQWLYQVILKQARKSQKPASHPCSRVNSIRKRRR